MSDCTVTEIVKALIGRQKRGILFLLLSLCFCQDLVAKDELVPVFEFQDEYMNQTVYFIKIYEDGKLHYHGNTSVYQGNISQAVSVIGDRYGHITQEQLKELIDTFLSLPFKEHEKYETKRAHAIQASVILFKHANLRINIVDRIFFTAMTTKLKKVTDIQTWICFQKGHPDYSEHCLEDLPPDFEY